MKIERITWIIILLCLIILALMMLPKRAGASDGLPTGVTVFEVGDHTCVLYHRGGTSYDEAELECFCPCDCSVSPNEPVKTEKPEPTPIPPTPTVEPTEKPKCNSGRGNGSEGSPDCDPGKSYKNQGGD